MDHLERVALVNEELLALVSIVHLLRVGGHQRVEVRIVVVQISSRLLLCVLLWSENATESLSFLSARLEVRRNLDDDIG